MMFVSHEQTYYSEYIVMKSALESSGYEVEVRSATSLDFSVYMDPYISIPAAADDYDYGDYAQFQTQFQNNFDSPWDEALNSVPSHANVDGSIVEIESMDNYVGLIVVGGLGALDYRMDGDFNSQGSGIREISTQLVQQVAEKLNDLALDAISHGKPVMAQCHGSSIPVFWRVPDTAGTGAEAIGFSLLKGGRATGFPDSDTPVLLHEFDVEFMVHDRVTISNPYSELLDDASGNGLIVTTRDWYPQTVAYAARTFLNILESYPLIENRTKTVHTLILHGGELNAMDCSPSNRINDIPCNYPSQLPADFQDLMNLLESTSGDDFVFEVDHLDVTSSDLPYENQITSFIYDYLIQFDVVIFYKHWSTGFTNQLLQALEDYVDDGGGLVSLHHGLYNDIDPGGQSKDILVNLFGAQSSESGWSAQLDDYQLYNTNYGHFITSFMTYYDSAILEPEVWTINPLPENANSNSSYLPAKSVNDELYLNMAFEESTVFGRDDNQTIGLLSNAEDPDFIQHTSAFCKEVDLDENLHKGRVFYLQVGENPENYLPNSFIGQVIRNGIRWSARVRINQEIIGSLTSTRFLSSESFQLSPIANSGLPVEFRSSDPTIVEISGDSAIIHKKGNVILTASQSGNFEYYATSREFPIEVIGMNQNLFLWDRILYQYGDPKFRPVSIESGLELEYHLSNDSVIQVVGDSAQIIGAGSVQLVAFNSGNDFYEEARDTTDIRIQPKPLKVSLMDTVTYGDSPDFTNYSYEGFVNGENEDDLDSKPVVIFDDNKPSFGKHRLTLAGGESNNYEFSYEYSELTVTKAPLLVGISDSTVIATDQFIELDLEFEGFQYGENESEISRFPVLRKQLIDFNVPGSYPIQLVGGNAENYEFLDRGDTLLVLPSDILELTDPLTFRVFPNPIVSELKVNPAQGDEDYTIVITDISGKHVMRKDQLLGSESISMISVTPGVYILNILVDNKSVHKLLLVKDD